MRQRLTLLAMLAGCTIASFHAARASQDPPDDAPPVLSGPKVPDALVRTLVRRDAKGNFQRADGRPEEAALSLLGLSAEEKDRARKVITERAVGVCEALLDHSELARNASVLAASGKRDEAAKLVRELWDGVEPDHPQSPMLYQLGEVLGPAHQAELSRVVDEYWKVWIDWELRTSKDKSDAARARVRDRLVFQLFQDEVRQAYDRVIRPYEERVRVLYAVLEPTEEQRGAIRDAVIEFVRESRARPTPDQRRALLTKIYTLLDEERRVKYFDLIARQLVEAQG